MNPMHVPAREVMATRAESGTQTDPITDWLMEGDPAIRWQTMRDLLESPSTQWQSEQQRTLREGWGARLLSLQDSDGRWGGGLYLPKWTSTTYTLLTLRDIGIPRSCASAQQGAHVLLDGMLGKSLDHEFQKELVKCDRCVVGMLLSLAVYFEIDDPRIDAIVRNLLEEMMPDGAWNCRRSRHPRPTHSSFHTTLNVLDGLRDYIELGNGTLKKEALVAEQSALELLLAHKLFRSDKTNQIIDDRFTLLSYPARWHYDVLRALSHFARANAPRDPRAQEVIDLLCQKRRKDGLWPVQHKYAGRVYFDMEKTGGPSRWNTLRALRVLKWWNSYHQSTCDAFEGR